MTDQNQDTVTEQVTTNGSDQENVGMNSPEKNKKRVSWTDEEMLGYSFYELSDTESEDDESAMEVDVDGDETVTDEDPGKKSKNTEAKQGPSSRTLANTKSPPKGKYKPKLITK